LNIDEKLAAVKNGKYNFDQEEIRLNELIKALRTNSKEAKNMFLTVGLLNFTAQNNTSSNSKDS
jgi:hypothetical protein